MKGVVQGRANASSVVPCPRQESNLHLPLRVTRSAIELGGRGPSVVAAPWPTIAGCPNLSPPRFVAAQTPGTATSSRVAAGRKRTTGCVRVPAVEGLGRAPARRYASRARRGRAYAAHALLGARLRECTRLVLRHRATPVGEIMGSPDDVKLRSSMTLFRRAAPDEPAFAAAIDAFWDGREDEATLRLLGS